MMTAFATVDTAREAFKLGADDFIQKPFDVDELKLIVDKALEKLDLLQRESRLPSALNASVASRKYHRPLAQACRPFIK